VRQSSKTEDFSKLLADKLLQGWKMLADVCATCLVPLMSKGNETICVGCNTKSIKKVPVKT